MATKKAGTGTKSGTAKKQAKSAEPAPVTDVAAARWTRPRAEAHVRQQTFRCRPVTAEDRAKIAGLSGEGRIAYDAGLIARCGAELTDLIAGAPFDGEVHSATCPNGHPFTWRAPWFPGVDGMGAEGPTNE